VKNRSTFASNGRVASVCDASSSKRRVRHLLVVAAAAALTLCSSSAFAGWARGGTAYTGRGEYQGAHVGSCGGGSCSHAGGVENPWGRVATNSGTVTRTAPGQFSNSGTAYGPNGRSVQHAGDTSSFPRRSSYRPREAARTPAVRPARTARPRPAAIR